MFFSFFFLCFLLKTSWSSGKKGREKKWADGLLLLFVTVSNNKNGGLVRVEREGKERSSQTNNRTKLLPPPGRTDRRRHDRQAKGKPAAAAITWERWIDRVSKNECVRACVAVGRCRIKGTIFIFWRLHRWRRRLDKKIFKTLVSWFFYIFFLMWVVSFCRFFFSLSTSM